MYLIDEVYRYFKGMLSGGGKKPFEPIVFRESVTEKRQLTAYEKEVKLQQEKRRKARKRKRIKKRGF